MSFSNSKKTAKVVTNLEVANDPTLRIKNHGFATIKQMGQRVWVRIMADMTVTRTVRKAVINAIDFGKHTALSYTTRKAGAVTRYELTGPQSIVDSLVQ